MSSTGRESTAVSVAADAVALAKEHADRADALGHAMTALVEDWRRKHAWRLEFRDSMAMPENRAYQEGYADALGDCLHALQQVTRGLALPTN